MMKEPLNSLTNLLAYHWPICLVKFRPKPTWSFMRVHIKKSGFNVFIGKGCQERRGCRLRDNGGNKRKIQGPIGRIRQIKYVFKGG